jgi:hypothetical protein
MAQNQLPTVYIAETAKQKIFAEVERWAKEGLAREGVPYEAIVYPLSALLGKGKRGSLPTPLEDVLVSDIGSIVVVDAAIPPDTAKNFSAYNCHFQALDADVVSFDDQLSKMIEARPRLAVFSKLHSHPFQNGDFLSSGDLMKNVYHPSAIKWRTRLGMQEALLHVVYPRIPVRDIVQTKSGTFAQSEFSQETRLEEQEAARRKQTTASTSHASDRGPWGIATFAVEGTGKMVRLPGPVYIANDHPLIQEACEMPYWSTPRGKAWDDKQKTALAKHGFKPSRGWLRHGWRRYLLSLEGLGNDVVFCVPPDFPKRQLKALSVIDATRNIFERLPLPKKILATRRLSDIDLSWIARQYRAEAARKKLFQKA